MNVSITQMIRDLTARRGAIERLSNTAKPRLSDGVLVAQMATLVLAQIEQQAPTLAIPADQEEAQHVENLRAIVREMMMRLIPKIKAIQQLASVGIAGTSHDELITDALRYATADMLLWGLSDNAKDFEKELQQAVNAMPTAQGARHER